MSSAAEIAVALDLRRVLGRQEWRGACPACGYRAGLVLADKEGRAVWWCASCQDQDGVTAAIRQALGGSWTPPQALRRQPAATASTAHRTALARDRWNAALPHSGTLVDRYLAARGLAGVQSAALRFHPAAPHPNGARLPAMIAAVRATGTGELQAIHRTYLRHDGSGKAAIEPAKASLGPVAGGAVQLDALQPGTPLVIGEGIESSLSAARIIGGTAWCAISAGNLAALPLPALPAAAVVVIAADPDAPGRRAAATAARRWHAEGRQVRIAAPENLDTDFNDMLRARLAASESNHG